MTKRSVEKVRPEAVAMEVDNDPPQRPNLSEIAAKMRAAAIERGMTGEIFDAIMDGNLENPA
jgi:hypothetical protein